jgi:methyl-accepting chemotaxis protein
MERRFMKNSKMGIKGKLLLLVGGAVGVFAIMTLFSIITAIDLRSQIEILGLQRIPLSEALGDIRTGSNAVPRFMWLSLAQAPGSPERSRSLEQVTDYWETWKKSVDHTSNYHISDEAKQKVTEIRELMPKLSEVIEQGKSALARGTKEQDMAAKDILMTRMPPLAVKLTTLVKDLSKIVESRNNAFVADAQTQVTRAITMLVVLTLAFGFALTVFGYFFATKLAKQLLGITESVAEASHQVSAASSQLSNAAEQLSSASQEQAAATEQTSASLTEISGMVEANVQGAEMANEFARDVHSISEVTKKSMEDLKSAMGEIFESNGRIEQLVKVIEEIGEKTEVIDDIVFKTQLLSFNASVEAERAGEHGRGFAVVAQEVGNLAQMSGKAATEIANIVKHSIKEATSVATENKSRVQKGESLAGETGSKMSRVLESLANILEATNKIVAASKEQSQGIGQITTSVDGLNQSTQEIASTAEESASASEELAGQAQSLLSLVQDLRGLVTGDGRDERSSIDIASTRFNEKRDGSKNLLSMSDHQRKSVAKAQVKPRATSNNTTAPSKKAAGSDLNGNDEWEKL